MSIHGLKIEVVLRLWYYHHILNNNGLDGDVQPYVSAGGPADYTPVPLRLFADDDQDGNAHDRIGSLQWPHYHQWTTADSYWSGILPTFGGACDQGEFGVGIFEIVNNREDFFGDVHGS